MKRIPAIVTLLMLTGLTSLLIAQAPADPQPAAERFGVKYREKSYPQASPKETLGSVIEAASTGRMDYLVAHLLEPSFIDAKIAERRRLLEPAVEVELIEKRHQQRLRPFANDPDRLPDDPQKFARIVEQIARQRALQRVMDEIRARLADDPESLKLLRRFYREGEFVVTEPTAKATLANVKDHAVYFRKLGERWFMENRYSDPPGQPAANP